MKKHPSDDQPHSEVGTSGTHRVAKAGPRLILFAEDSAVQSLRLKELLERAGYRVIATADGRAAVERARAAKPDLILLDLEMPIMGGIDACALIKADPTIGNTPVLMLTAHDDPKNLVAAFDAGCSGYISKSLKEQLLLAKVELQLGGRRDKSAMKDAVG